MQLLNNNHHFFGKIETVPQPPRTATTMAFHNVALIIVDPQFDFGNPAGALYVPGGEDVVPKLNALRAHLSGRGAAVYITQDWHPSDHISFAANNPGTKPLEEVRLADGTLQTMWPTHCMQGSSGAAFLDGLHSHPADIVIPKGTKQDVDSYSGFGSQDGVKEVTPLLASLRQKGILHVVVAGLAFDYCVSYTAKDAVKHGFKVYVVREATKGISATQCAKEEALMKELDIEVLETVKSVFSD